jgi:hypothetical protein
VQPFLFRLSLVAQLRTQGLHHRSWSVLTRHIGLVEEIHRLHPALVLRCDAGARLTPVVATAKHWQKQPLCGRERASPTHTLSDPQWQAVKIAALHDVLVLWIAAQAPPYSVSQRRLTFV